MNKEELRIKQAAFEGNRQGFAKTHKALEKLRLKFIAKFSLGELRNMPVEKYALQKGKAESKDTFCYWIETTLKELGNIKGSTAFKFGIYYGITNSDSTLKYRFTSKWGNSPEEAYQKIAGEDGHTILVPFTGDVNFSESEVVDRLIEIFDEVEIIPGISSTQVAASKAKVPTDKSKVITMHISTSIEEKKLRNLYYQKCLKVKFFLHIIPISS